MRRKLAVLGAALVLSVGGCVLSPPSLATADSDGTYYCEYDPVTGSYIGAYSTVTGEPLQLTEAGCLDTGPDQGIDPLIPETEPYDPEIELYPPAPGGPYLGQ